MSTYSSNYIYRSCNNCGTVDIVPKDAESKLGPIYTMEPYETRKCENKDCKYYWVYKTYLSYAQAGKRIAEQFVKDIKIRQ